MTLEMVNLSTVLSFIKFNFRNLAGEFRSYFEKYGKVVSAEVMFNRETHKSRGFGFIVFELEQGAIKVCTEKEHYIDGKLVRYPFIFPGYF